MDIYFINFITVLSLTPLPSHQNKICVTKRKTPCVTKLGRRPSVSVTHQAGKSRYAKIFSVNSTVFSRLRENR